ncbi:hypothetical protein ALQ88_200059 [Pseudomonas savastanoi]|nr:hypothetical protein ALQ88_200059 [Pseudomonas savastanoi]
MSLIGRSTIGVPFILFLLRQSVSFSAGSPVLFGFVSGQLGLPSLLHAVVAAQIHVQGRVLLDVGFIDLGTGGFHPGNGGVAKHDNTQQPHQPQRGQAQVKGLLVLGIACAFGPHVKGPTGLGAGGLRGRGVFRCRSLLRGRCWSRCGFGRPDAIWLGGGPLSVLRSLVIVIVLHA